MEIHKIKFLKDGKIRIVYDQNGDEFDTKFKDHPLESFPAAMAALIPPALDLLELPLAYDHNMTASGISFSDTDGIMGAVVTLQKTLVGAHSPLVLNTPHLAEEPYGESGDASCLLPEKLVDALQECIDEAGRYIRGERSQLDMLLKKGDGGESLDEVAEEVSDFIDRAITGRVGMTTETVPIHTQ